MFSLKATGAPVGPRTRAKVKAVSKYLGTYDSLGREGFINKNKKKKYIYRKRRAKERNKR